MVMVANNLMSLFRQAALRASVIHSDGRDVQHTLKTLQELPGGGHELHRPSSNRIAALRHASPELAWPQVNFPRYFLKTQ